MIEYVCYYNFLFLILEKNTIVLKPVIFLAFANDKVDYARYLRNLPIELDGIRKALAPAVEAGLCEVVERASCTLENILDVFQKYLDRIAIFHYGGHADGYQLLLEQLDGSHAVAHGGGLVSFFAKQKSLKLVFFNGCSTQQQSLELVENGVPLVVGTSNSINDEVATQLSIRFYKGLGIGLSMERAWNDTLDALKIENGSNLKAFYRNKKDLDADVFPWNMYVREGSEIVKQWNLPDEVKNPLFGLPAPLFSHLPERPFRFLERYKKQDAEIFFGRSFYIRELYNRCTDPNSAPVILLYGQSGSGKSSLLDAGLVPRLEQSSEVIYLRRDQELGLLGTLQTAFQVKNPSEQEENKQAGTFQYLQNALETAEGYLKIQINQLIQQIQNQQISSGDSLKNQWIEAEQKTQRPFIILLDQAEEVFTRPMLSQPDEWQVFLQEVYRLFDNLKDRPQGKLVISYRKEYHPEIKELLVHFAIPREEVFLQHLDRNDIIEVVGGLSKNQKLQRKYGFKAEDNLAEEIADDLVASSTTSIAPVLQITLTKLWNMVENQDEHLFTIQNYRHLKKDGIFMGDFFDQQMKKFILRYVELEKTGLALDILYHHTTDLGTANVHSLEELRERYGANEERINEIEALVKEFSNLYLLVENQKDYVGLAHDTLAPVVQQRYKHSDKAGQRAAIILENKSIAFEQNGEVYLDLDDLQIVEQGKNGMRIWTGKEEELIAKSQKRRTEILEREKRQRYFRNAMFVTVSVISIVAAILAVWGYREQGKAKESAKIAEKNAQEAEVNLKEVYKEQIDGLNERRELLQKVGACPDQVFLEFMTIAQNYPEKDSVSKDLEKTIQALETSLCDKNIFLQVKTPTKTE